jgi:hypothetical protein
MTFFFIVDSPPFTVGEKYVPIPISSSSSSFGGSFEQPNLVRYAQPVDHSPFDQPVEQPQQQQWGGGGGGPSPSDGDTRPMTPMWTGGDDTVVGTGWGTDGDDADHEAMVRREQERRKQEQAIQDVRKCECEMLYKTVIKLKLIKFKIFVKLKYK